MPPLFLRAAGAFGLLALTALLAPPALVKDLRTIPDAGADPGSDPTYLTAFNGGVAFSAARAGDRELWFSDGTPAGTTLVRDVRAGPEPSNPSSFAVAGGRLFFIATYGPRAYDQALFVSDGTPAGTQLVKRIGAGAEMTAVGANVYFVAGSRYQWSLWISDGTEAGTRALKVISTNDYLAAIHGTAVGSALFFVAYDATSGTELWRSDGTTDGTAMVKDIYGGYYTSNPSNLTAVGSTLFFSADDGVNGAELWKSDGTATGTVMVKDIRPGYSASSPLGLTAVGSRLFFFATDGTTGIEPWMSDGTGPGTVQVKDVLPGSGSSINTYYAAGRALGSKFIFLASTGTTGTQLWGSDGTPAGTTMIPGSAGGYFSPGMLTVAGATAFFIAWPSTTGDRTQLWKSDGTTTGTVPVKDLPYVGGLTPEWKDLTASGDRLFFTAVTTALGRELWISDGTTNGTVPTRNIDRPSTSSDPAWLVAHGRRLLFSADDGVAGIGTWLSDGTAPGTGKLAAIRPIPANVKPDDHAALGGWTYFAADDGTAGLELWRTDGSTAQLVKDIKAGSAGSEPYGFTAWGGAVYFFADDGVSGRELWRTDGTAAGTTLVKDICPGATGGVGNWEYPPVAVGGALLFEAGDGVNGAELWRTDGTAAGTAMVKNARAWNEPLSFHSLKLVPVGNVAYFLTWWGQYSYGYIDELWVTDGTAGGTVSIATWDNSPGMDNVAGIAPLADGRIAFVADGHHLWVSDGSPLGTYEVMDWQPGASASWYDGTPTAAAGRVFFPADDLVHGRELWVTDGTVPGTVRVTDLAPGPDSSVGDVLLAGRDGVWFSATNGASGLELWFSDGTPEGTRMEADLAAGPSSSSPGPMAPAGGRLFFAATDRDGDRELYSTLVDTTGPSITPTVVGQQGASGWYTSDVAVSFTVSDAESPVVTQGCTPSTIAVDTAATTLTCSAESWGGSDSVSVTVKRDATAPVFSCPASETVEATGPDGVSAAAIPMPSVQDPLDPAPALGIDLAPGATVPLGTTQVTATATDQAGNTSTCTFSAVVQDTTAPALQCPSDQSAAPGATVSFAATATDAVDASPALTYSQAPGTVFPVGTTQVTATATDDAGNTSTCTFSVVVGDTTAPVLQCPPEQTATTSGVGATVSFAATATDAVDPSPAITYSQAPGTVFPVGTTQVFVTATDAYGNQATCSFLVSVEGQTPQSCGCGGAPSAPIALGVLVLAAARLLRSRSRERRCS